MKARFKLWIGLFFVLSMTAHAQSSTSVTPDQEYQKLIQVDQNIQPLGEHPFGENINLYDGTLSFELSDVSLRGSGPTIELGRTLSFWGWADPSQNALRPFGDWDLDIPRIETLAGGEGTPIWQTGVGGTTPTVGTTQRCSNFAPPPGIASTLSEGGWVPDEWWYGYNLLVPGQAKQLLMPRVAANALSPTISGMSFPIVTKNNWMISCGVTASDGGEGFLAIAPDGTRYTFAHLVYRPYNTIIGAGALPPDVVSAPKSSTLSAHSATPLVGAPGGIGLLFRRDAFMYVTQIQDRFGNTLTYNYDSSTGYLNSITANDGREVDLAYTAGSPLVQSITEKAADVPSRTWTYSYTVPTQTDAMTTLTGVQLPDGSAWSYQLGFIQSALIYPTNGNCQLNTLPNLISTGGAVPTITAPSGLTATFNVAARLGGRSYVPRDCYGNDEGTANISIYPEYAAQFAMTSEVVSGAGMPTETWSYSYSPTNQSWGNDPCATSGTCATTVYTDVTDPNGNDTRYTFSNRFDASEGQLKQTDYYSGSASGTLMRSEASTYASPTGGPWPASYGTDLLYRDNQLQVSELSPLSQRTITEEGDSYVWSVNSFNNYAQPTDVSRYNSIAGPQCLTSITPENCIRATTTYLNDPALWVLDLPEVVTNTTNGASEVESQNTYNVGVDDTLLSRARFGQTLMNYTFSAGQLASFTDGNNHTTSLSNYKRGIPQSISYPDNKSESLVVDDLGEISSLTDQNANTTGYSYDPVGRIAGITYPTGDAVALYPTTFTYSFVAAAERGVAANHWRRTKTTGSAVDTTYFDAMLRPVLSDTSIPGTEITTGDAYDWKGQTTFASYPTSGAPDLSALTSGTHHIYDALERVTQVQQDSELGTLTTGTAYLSGAGKQVTDPKGNITTTYAQVFDEPSYSAPIQVQAPTGITQTIVRDVYGNPQSVTQSGLYGSESKTVTKTLTYDSYRRLCRSTEPETGSEIITYDGANNIQTTASGLTISDTGCGTSPTASQTAYTYDAMNRVLTIGPPSPTQSTIYTYDGVGNNKTSISGTAIQGFSYSTRNLVTNESLWLPNSGLSWGLSYGYDGYGNVSNVVYPNGENVAYAPDALGRATQAGSYASGASYFPNNNVSSFTYGNGIVYVAELNARQSLSNFSYGTSNTVSLSEDLIYDPNGNITNVNDLVNGPRTKTFGYDGLNRLTSAQAPGLNVNEAYTYDALNNLRSRLTGGVTFNFNYDATNRLSSLTTPSGTTATYSYDTLGNRQSVSNGSTTTSYVFDNKNQLLQIPGLDTYAYDASGRRITKTTAGGSSTYSFYSKAGQLMYEAVPSSGQATNFIYLGSKMVARDVYTQLGAPASVTFDANPNNGSYTVSWGAVPAATSYNAQESANGGAWTAVYAGSGTSVALSGRAGGSYVYQVQACTSAACGAWTSSATLGVTPALPIVTVPSGTVNGTYTVSWTVPVSATTFDVQERVNGGTWTTIASATTATSIARPGTTSGSYAYQVDANNAYGNRGWASSSAVTVDTSYGVVPTAPTSLTVPASSTTGNVTLSWGAANSVTSYTVQQSANGGASWSTVYTGASTSTALSGLADGSYTYQVQACNQYGCSAWVRGGTLTVLLPPPEPASITSPATSNGPVPLSWSASATATSYTLQHAIYDFTGWSTIYTGAATSFTQNETATSAGWIYQVQACNSSGCSAFRLVSGGTSVTIPPSSAPGLSVPASSNSGSYAVSWSAVTGAATYTLQQRLNGGAWSTVQASSATSESFSGKGNGSYGYQVQACNAGGCGPWSGIGTVVVALIPATPTLTVKQSPGASQHILASLSWTAEPTATTYVAQDESGTIITQDYSGPNTTWSGGYTGALRTFRVEACNSSGCSPWTGWQ